MAGISASAQDVLITQEGDVKKVYDVEVGPSTVFYKEADKADALIAKYPFYTKVVIPAGTYAGFNEDVPAISVMAMLVCTDKVDDTMGYDITKALFTNLDRIKAAHSVGKLITKEGAMEGMPIQMNAGAEKFFKE